MPNVKTIKAEPARQITPACDALSQHIQANRAVLMAAMSRPKARPTSESEPVDPDAPIKQAMKTVGLTAWHMLEPRMGENVKQKPLATLGLAFIAGFVVVSMVLKPKAAP